MPRRAHLLIPKARPAGMDDKEAAKKAYEILIEFTKQIMTICAAILTFFVSLVVAKLIGVPNASKTVLVLSFVAMGLTILCSFWVMLAIAGTLDAIAFPGRSEAAKLAADHPSIYRASIRIPLMATLGFFLLALGLLVWAALAG